MFTVRWKRTAMNELTSLWTEADADQRRAITEATHQIDQQLQRDPDEQGESRPNNRRIFLVAPLGVVFTVDHERPSSACCKFGSFSASPFNEPGDSKPQHFPS